MAKRVKLNSAQKRVLRNAVAGEALDAGLPEKADRRKLDEVLRSLLALGLLDAAGFATRAGRELLGKAEVQADA